MRRRLPVVLILLSLAACGRSGSPPLSQAAGETQSGQATVPDGTAIIADNSLVIGSQTYRLGATGGAPLIGSTSA